MNVTKDKITISESAGTVSCEVTEPNNMSAMLVLAHGAGAGMNHPFMVKLSHVLAENSIGTVRFNFPYMEQKKKRPDFAPVAEKTVACAVDYALNKFRSVPLFAGGKSFGGRMTSQWLSKEHGSTLKGVVFFGFPLHAAGKPSSDRAAHLSQVLQPMLFLQGTRDALAQLDLLEPVCQSLPKATLVKFEGADHAFYAGKKTDLIPALAEETYRWIQSLK